MADRLWSKGLDLNERVHRFTVGDDPITDLRLVPYDCMGSAAHARGLCAIGLLSSEDTQDALQKLEKIAETGLTISPEQEDCHTAIEQALGDVGKRIHLGRSRNDQVATAMRLWMRDAIFELTDACGELGETLAKWANHHGRVPLPGYTHLRRAMPSNFAQWGAATVEGLAEEIQNLDAVFRRINRSPLGGAAGFGVPLPLDRHYTAQLLGFPEVQISPIDVQNSRGRHEGALVHACSSIALVLEKFLWDLSLYSTEEFGFLSLPDSMTTGSSIMPQKRNPDVIELARGKCREIRGLAAQLDHLAGGLPSSYHRDFQLFKAPTFRAVDLTLDVLAILAEVVPGLKVDLQRCKDAMSADLYATQAACDLALEGTAFRDAYKQVAEQVLNGSFTMPETAAASHLGSPQDPGLGTLEARMDLYAMTLLREKDRLDEILPALWTAPLLTPTS